VQTPEAWQSANDASAHSVVLGLTNRELDAQIPMLQRALEERRFRRVLNFLEFHLLFPELPVRYEYTFGHAPFAQDPRPIYSEAGPKLDRLDQLLTDEESRQWLEGIVRFRLMGDYAALPPPSRTDQYHPDGLPAWPNPLRLIDCGAYTGDTLADLTQSGYALDAVAAFEPDPDNFARLVSNTLSSPGMIRFPCALGARTESICFEATHDSCSHVAPEGEITLQCVRLDDVLPAFRPNLIKMDIEGAEPEALLGARQMIARNRPGLAISVYHRQEQLWEIPLLIEQICGGSYSFSLRGHDVKTIETILYAYPTEWLR
jgi:FkbM family methyltransferase